MSKRLVSFLADLATSPESLKRYLEDREGFVARSGLSQAEKSAVLGGDQDRIAALAGFGGKSHTKAPPMKKAAMKKKKKKKKKAAKKKATKKKKARKK